MLLFAIQPDWSTRVAHRVGISRGVDLLFYLSHLMLFFVAFAYYLKFKKMEARLTKSCDNSRSSAPGRSHDATSERALVARPAETHRRRGTARPASQSAPPGTPRAASSSPEGPTLPERRLAKTPVRPRPDNHRAFAQAPAGKRDRRHRDEHDRGTMTSAAPGSRRCPCHTVHTVPTVTFRICTDAARMTTSPRSCHGREKARDGGRLIGLPSDVVRRCRISRLGERCAEKKKKKKKGRSATERKQSLCVIVGDAHPARGKNVSDTMTTSTRRPTTRSQTIARTNGPTCTFSRAAMDARAAIAGKARRQDLIEEAAYRRQPQNLTGAQRRVDDAVDELPTPAGSASCSSNRASAATAAAGANIARIWRTTGAISTSPSRYAKRPNVAKCGASARTRGEVRRLRLGMALDGTSGRGHVGGRPRCCCPLNWSRHRRAGRHRHHGGRAMPNHEKEGRLVMSVRESSDALG